MNFIKLFLMFLTYSKLVGTPCKYFYFGSKIESRRPQNPLCVYMRQVTPHFPKGERPLFQIRLIFVSKIESTFSKVENLLPDIRYFIHY